MCVVRQTVKAIVNKQVMRTNYNYRQGGNYNDVLPLKAARRDRISNLTSFGCVRRVKQKQQ